jgi:hypothetical protein
MRYDIKRWKGKNASAFWKMEYVGNLANIKEKTVSFFFLGEKLILVMIMFVANSNLYGMFNHGLFYLFK